MTNQEGKIYKLEEEININIQQLRQNKEHAREETVKLLPDIIFAINQLLAIEKNDKIIYDKQAGTEENVKDSKTYIISDNPEVGMNKEEVLYQTNWGEPQKKNIGKYTWGTSEQWCYSNNRYVYFENGIVVAVDYEE